MLAPPLNVLFVFVIDLIGSNSSRAEVTVQQVVLVAERIDHSSRIPITKAREGDF
jgi:hypothetical protein